MNSDDLARFLRRHQDDLRLHRDDLADVRLRSLDRAHRTDGFYRRFDPPDLNRTRRAVGLCQRAFVLSSVPARHAARRHVPATVEVPA